VVIAEPTEGRSARTRSDTRCAEHGVCADRLTDNRMTISRWLGSSADWRYASGAMARDLLTPQEAQNFVEERIESFGLSAVPRVLVREEPDGRWHVRWESHVRVERPMTMAEWESWLERHVGTVDPERLGTNEG
jgi:hypothetical protein